MVPSIVQQFGAMLSTRWNLGKELQPTSSRPPIHETVTYPRIKVTADNNSCLNPSMSYEHILACGHIITTANPSESCAPNCHHVTNARVTLKKKKGVGKSEGEGKEFYCDACAEADNEAIIPENATATAAESIRATMREAEAKRRGKATNYRKCYIGLKVTSVPCHTDGSVRSRYVPRKEHHPFDTSIPQTGDNFYEDMLVDPPSDTEMASEESATPPGSPIAGDSPASLGEAGANYLEYTCRVAQNESAARSTQTPRLKLKLKAGGLKTSKVAPEVTRSVPGKATPKAATLRTGAPRTAAQILRSHPTTAAPVTQNAESTTPLRSPQHSRKRPVVEDEDDYEEIEKEEKEEERPSKRRKATPSTAKTAIPEAASAKSSAKTANAKNRLKTVGVQSPTKTVKKISMAVSVKKTATPVARGQAARRTSPISRGTEHLEKETGTILRHRS